MLPAGMGDCLFIGLKLFHAVRYFGYFLPRMPPKPALLPVFSETDFCRAPFAALPATPSKSGTNLGLDVVH
jgi:hypothetical protein